MLSFRRFETLRRFFALRFRGCELHSRLLRDGLLAREMEVYQAVDYKRGTSANSVRGSGAVFLGFGAGGMFTTLEGSNRAPCIVR